MITVTKTYLPDIKKYKKYIDEIYKEGWLTNNGKLVRELEERLKEYLGVKNIVLVCNGTIALNIAYRLLNIEGEVITTPFTFIATTSSMLWDKIQPVFVDINEDDYNIDVNKIEENITKNTKAIIPVHVFGNACKINKINEIAEKYSLKVIYDASHCFGVKYKNQSILNYGDISTISFHSTKLFHTIEGGAIIVNDDKLYKKAKQIINFGFDENGYISEVGINAKMNEFQAAMGLSILDDIDSNMELRKEKYDYYLDQLKGINDIRFQKINQYVSKNYSYLPVVFKSKEKLNLAIKKMNHENIYPRRYFYPSIDSIRFIESNRKMIKSQYISERIICLPLYECLEKTEIDNIVNIIKEINN